jgi:hypothetical protein
MASWKVHSKGHFGTAQVLRIESQYGLTFKQFPQTLSFFPQINVFGGRF